jgi:hypothetical protein
VFKRKQRQTCPRRMTDFGPWERAENLDTWIPGPGMGGHKAASPSCSFCGSLHPDRFLELIREGWIVGPTDKNYKAYLSQPLTEEEKTARKAQWMSGFTAAEMEAAAQDRGETPEQHREALATVYDSQIAPAEGGSIETKFYFQHLSEPQRHEFIQLYNDQTMRVGYPGHFYRLPLFITTGPAT